MIQTQDVFSVLKQINETVNYSLFQAEIQKLAKVRTNLQTNPIQTIPQLLPIIDKLDSLIKPFQKFVWTTNQEIVINNLGLGILLDETKRNYFSTLKTQLQSNPSNATILTQNITNDFYNPLSKAVQLYTQLQPFNIQSEVLEINNDEGIIEITFDGKVAIEDFQEARDQMNNWFLIIEGYAGLLDVRREDFEIISVSKNSPTKFKVKTALKNVASVVTILSLLLLMEKTILENKLMIEQLKKNSLVPDSAVQKKFIEDAEKHIDEKIQEGLKSITEQELNKHNIQEEQGDIKTVVAKGIANQYNFIINGGTVNVHVIGEQIKAERDTLEKVNNDVKRIKEAYENQKLLSSEQSDTSNID